MAYSTPVIENRAARHNFDIEDTFELGIMLQGTEVKSIREGKMTLGEAFVLVKGTELWLINAYVNEYGQGNIWNHKPTRERKLLAHKHEITKMHTAVGRKGMTLVPLKAYFKGSNLKILVGVGKGKNVRDKRHDKTKQQAKIEISRAIKNANNR